MAKEFIIRNANDWRDVSKITAPVIGKKPFRVVLHRGLKRTIDQNKLLHAVFEECAEKCFAIHSINKDAYWWKVNLKDKLGKKAVFFDLDEQPIIVVHSTTEYSTKELSDFCEKIVAYMKTEYQVDIALPDELKGRTKPVAGNTEHEPHHNED